jgi:tripartite ATP-independent transporter DctM subunit
VIEISPLLILVIVFAAVLFLVLAGLRIGFALVVVGVISLVVFPFKPLLQPIAETGWTVLNSFVLTAVPLFIFMGQILSRGHISEQLYRATEQWLSRLPGGLAHVNIASCAIFAALSGSSLATCAGIGAVAIPAMDSRGYNRRLTLGSLGAGGTLGILIPPSVPMILYGYIANVSIGRLFMGGVVPGIILSLAFMAFIFAWSLRAPSIAPRLDHSPSWSERVHSLWGAVPPVILILLVLGSIYIGVATPTEAAALGAVGAVVVTIFQGNFTWRMLKGSLKETALTTGMIGLIMEGAMIIAWAFHILRVPITLSETIAGSGLNRYVAFALIILLLYALGCFIDGISILLIMTPILAPIMTALGFDLVWFGIVFVLTIEISLITPPVGMNLFILKGVSPQAKMEDIILGIVPYVGILTLGIIVLTIWPALALWFPNLMMGN